METPDGRWRVEVARQGDVRWYRVVHEDNIIDGLDLPDLEKILAKAKVEMHTLAKPAGPSVSAFGMTTMPGGHSPGRAAAGRGPSHRGAEAAAQDGLVGAEREHHSYWSGAVSEHHGRPTVRQSAQEVLERAGDAAGADRLRRFGLTATGGIATGLDFGS